MKKSRDRRLVVKVGTNTLVDQSGQLDPIFMAALVSQLAALTNDGYDVALVSSGAVRAGMAALGIDSLRSLRESQAAAAVGQGRLMHIYHELFEVHRLAVAQILLISHDFEFRKRYLNARNTLSTLFEHKIVPIINENDTVSVEEIKFGDNDGLASQVAGLIDAGILMFLSDIDGLHARDGEKLGAKIDVVEKVTPDIQALAGYSVGKYSRGGMVSKVANAKIATEGGTRVYIAKGREQNVIPRLLSGEPLGTVFYPQTGWRDSRKRWIGMSGAVAGTLVVDGGASEVLVHGNKSLLPAGVVAVEGHFQAGDVVRIVGADRNEVGRGLTNYSSEEIARIRGVHSSQVEAILGYHGDQEIIHRDNMFTFKALREDGHERK